MKPILEPIQVYALGFLLFCTIVLFLLFFRSNQKRIGLVLAKLRPFRIIHYQGMIFGGFILGWIQAGRPQFWISDYFIFPGLCLLSLLSFQSAVFVNDWFDLELDRLSGMKTPLSSGLISFRETKILFSITLLFSLLFSLSFHWFTLICIMLFHVLSISYSAPPLRIKRFYPLSIFSIACWGLVLMLAGFSVMGKIETLTLFPRRMILLVLITLTLSFGTKDIKDVKGDRERGISSLLTLLDIKTGRIVNGLLVFTGYFVAPIILDYSRLFFLSIPCGIASFLISIQNNYKEWMMFLIYYSFGLTIFYLILSGALLN